jgi:DNA primase
VTVARLPQNADPHDVLRLEGAGSLTARIAEAPDGLAWLLDDADPNETGLSPADKSERVGAILDILQAIPDAILRHEQCARLSRHAAIPQDILWDRIRPKTGRPVPGRPGPPPPGTPGNRPVLQGGEIPAGERRILQILLTEPDHKPLILGTLKEEFVTHPGAIRIISTLQKASRNREVVDFQRQIADLNEEDRLLVSGIALEDHPAPTEKGVEGLLKDLEKKYLERESAEIQRAIDRAEASLGAGADLADLIRAKQENSRRRMELSRSPRWKGN